MEPFSTMAPSRQIAITTSVSLSYFFKFYPISELHLSGQLFFDQSLISIVEETSPYSANTQQLTLNEDDSILSTEVEGTNGVDPVLEYVYLGDDIFDGLLA